MSRDEALRLVQGRPHDPLAWLALGRVMQSEGNVQAARDCYERALQLDPLLHEAHRALGTLPKGNNQTASSPVASFLAPKPAVTTTNVHSVQPSHEAGSSVATYLALLIIAVFVIFAVVNSISAQPPTGEPTSLPINTRTPSRSATPRPSSTAVTQITMALVVVEELNIRAGPDTSYEAIGRVRRDDELYVVANNRENTWVAIWLENDTCGWVSASTRYVRRAPVVVTDPEFIQGWERVRRNCRIPQTPTSTPYRPATGILKWYAPGNGGGELSIENRTGQDGVVIVTSLSGTRLVSAFVRTSGEFVITGIPDGVYAVSILTGEQWNDQAKRFTREVRYQRFVDAFDYATEQTSTSIVYRSWSISLHPVVGGDGRTEELPLDSIPDLR